MTFTHEGNKTYIDGLVNFEKMHMLAQTMRTIRYCRSRHLGELHYNFICWMYSTYDVFSQLLFGIPDNILHCFVNQIKNELREIWFCLPTNKRGGDLGHGSDQYFGHCPLSKIKISQYFGGWMCFYLQAEWGEDRTYSGGCIRKGQSQPLD